MDFTVNFDAINLLVVFAATLLANILGGLWYSPFVFGKVWRDTTGLPHDQPMKNPAGTFVSGFVLQLLAATMLAALLGPSAGGLEGVQLGSLIGVAFVFSAIGMTNLFEHRSIALILVHAGYHIAALSLMGFIIGTWG